MGPGREQQLLGIQPRHFTLIKKKKKNSLLHIGKDTAGKQWWNITGAGIKYFCPVPPSYAHPIHILKRLILQGREPEVHRRRSLVWPDATRGQRTTGTAPPPEEAQTLLWRPDPETQAPSIPKPETMQTTYTQASRPPTLTEVSSWKSCKRPSLSSSSKASPNAYGKDETESEVPTATTDLNTGNCSKNSLQTPPTPCTD